MLTASTKCMKYLLFISNFIFVLTGISLIVVGLIIRSENTQYNKVIDQDYASAANVLIFLGCFVFFVSFFGCCGAIKESHCMIFTFSVFMAAIFIAEIAVGVTGYMLKGEAYESVTDGLNSTMVKYNQSAEWTEFWDGIQGGLSCCGTKNYTDWTKILKDLPMTCCSPKKGAIGVVTCTVNSPELHKTPCIMALGDIVKENASTIGGTGLTIGFIQLLGVFISCYLAYSIRNDYESV
ncbi:CD63 antigen [Macrosteles quadrilineatus]|uniref:CD63 antigen n=1 Tax=Macrosteles quadrilineatus TaxID=74068 RepID=UPI0023E21FD7|nr:CD63 antigen [Macrosteles quadrilineatus]